MFCRMVAVVSAVVSVAVVVAESTISPQLPNLSVFSMLLHRVGGGQFARSLLTFALLAYPCMASLVSPQWQLWERAGVDSQ